MELATQRRLDHYLRYRRWYEVGFILLYAALSSAIHIAMQSIDIRRSNLPIHDWELYVWAISSDIAMLALLALLIIFLLRVPLTWQTWRSRLPWHVAASAIYCLLHVSAEVALRKAAYASVGAHYEFGNWVTGMRYEYLSDGRAYFTTMALVYCYRFILLRLQGEAKVLDKPDVGPSVDSADRPRRFLIRKLGKEFLIAVENIERLEAQGNYVNLHVGGYAYPLRSTMSAIETKLDPNSFVRIHRSHIINLDQLVEIQPLDTGDATVKLLNGALVPCSRNYRASLRKMASEPLPTSMV